MDRESIKNKLVENCRYVDTCGKKCNTVDQEDCWGYESDTVYSLILLMGQELCANCGLKHSVDEALNSGDGVYRP